MSHFLTFKEVTKFVKEKNQDPKLIESVDTLLGMTLVLAPVFLPVPGSPLPVTFSLLAVKNELVKAGRYVYEKLVREEDESSLDRYRRMEASYGLICFTAFFAAVDDLFAGAGEELRLDGQRTLASTALLRLGRRQGPEFRTLDKTEPGLEEYKLHFPHPADKPGELPERLQKFYALMSTGFAEFLKVTDHWEKLTEDERAAELGKVSQLPAKALEQFRAQYFDLAARFPLFQVWANLQEHERVRAEVTPRLDELLEGSEGLDIGLKRLGELVESLPGLIRRGDVERVFKDLQTYYSGLIEEPVLRDPGRALGDGEGADAGPQLTFPSKSAMFVPQSFKVIRYTGPERLEHASAWAAVKSRHDLEVFLYSYLSSPYSASAPLIILGHPGSGKSLLTQMLAARLGQRLLTPVRVELRDVNAEAEIANQIESQIYKDTKRKVGWAELTDHFPSPPLAIFDGYDELLQASGKVFADYPQKVQNFQLSEQHLKRGPVHAIITSRITLIDKAAIPVGSTVILLEPFDEDRQGKWMSVWNAANAEYFRAKGLREFEVPDEGKIGELAEQPLLLLMLALFDSQANELREQRGLDRTALYDNLIRRFIRREKEKDVKGFLQLPEPERDEQVDDEVKRLGVVAVGMFNRRSLYIRARELDEDLRFYEPEKPAAETAGRNLTRAQLLLGSFFFVNQSKATGRGEGANAGDSAYEFLHNTFGEFLTADFILRALLDVTEFVRDAPKVSSFKVTLERRLRGEDDYPEQWYGNLMCTHLHSRPVILTMMREWLKHMLAGAKRLQEDFVAELDQIVKAELSRVITKNNLPKAMTGGVALPYGMGHPLVGYLAVYTLNLMLLRTLLSPGGYVFDTAAFRSKGVDDHDRDKVNAWDRLTHLWRAWFTNESLAQLASVVETRREGGIITLTPPIGQGRRSFSPNLGEVQRVSAVLADSAVAGMSSLLTYDLAFSDPDALDEVVRNLREVDLDLDASIIIKRLQRLGLTAADSDSSQVVSKLVEQFLNIGWYRRVDEVELLLALRRCAGPRFNEEVSARIFDHFPFRPFSQLPAITALLIRAAYEMRDFGLLRYLFAWGWHNDSQKIPAWIKKLPPEVAVMALELMAEAAPYDFIQHFKYYLSKLDTGALWREWPHAALRLLRLARTYSAPEVRSALARLLPPKDSDYKTFLMEDALEVMRGMWTSGERESMRTFFEKYFIHGERLHMIPADQLPFAIVYADELSEEHWLTELFRRYAEIVSSDAGAERGLRPLMADLPLTAIHRFVQLARERGVELGEGQ